MVAEDTPGSSITAKEHEDLQDKRTAHTRRIVWPIYIVAGQLALLALAWGFFGVVRHMGQISLPRKMARLTQDNPQSKTYVVTVVATALSLFSSYLFSQAIRHALVIALTRPLPISQLGFGILISRRSLIYRREPLKWVLASGVLFLGTLTQTASWTSLLTPTHIDIRMLLRGTEIDLTSPAINGSFPQLWNSRLQTYINSSLLSIIEDSGTASATYRAGYPAVVDFAGWSHVLSTGGIYPIQVWGTDANGAALNMSDPQASYEVYQQGLSASVSCGYTPLDASTQPPLFRSAQQATTMIAGSPYEFTVASLSTNCAEIGGALTENSGYVPTNTNDTIFALGCADADNLSAETFTMIIEGRGTSYAYMQTVVCTISPQIQNMLSNYSAGFITSRPDGLSRPVPAGAFGFAGVFAVLEAFAYGQNLNRNTVGDAISAIFTDQVDPRLESPSVFLMLLEAYITGVIEFVGTAVKLDLVDYYQSTDGPLQNIARGYTGTVVIPSIGWEYRTVTGWLVLLAPTFVAIVSIAVVIAAQFYNHGISLLHADFDPNDPWRLMAAASAGGMLEIFHGVDEDDVEAGLEKKVRLGTFEGRDGLVEEGI